jgi:hypothetical protein
VAVLARVFARTLPAKVADAAGEPTVFVATAFLAQALSGKAVTPTVTRTRRKTARRVAPMASFPLFT